MRRKVYLTNSVREHLIKMFKMCQGGESCAGCPVRKECIDTMKRLDIYEEVES